MENITEHERGGGADFDSCPADSAQIIFPMELQARKTQEIGAYIMFSPLSYLNSWSSLAQLQLYLTRGYGLGTVVLVYR